MMLQEVRQWGSRDVVAQPHDWIHHIIREFGQPKWWRKRQDLALVWNDGILGVDEFLTMREVGEGEREAMNFTNIERSTEKRPRKA